MKKTCTMKSNFRRNSLANCSHPALRGFLFGNVQRQVKPPSMWAGRRKVPALTSVQGHCKSSTSSFTSGSPRVAVPAARVTGCRNVPPLLARKFGPHLSLVEFGYSEPHSSPPLHPSSCTFFSHWHLPTASCSLPCLHPLNHFSPRRCRD